MRFFYINNSLCEDCDECSVACPSAAVYASGGKRYIIHDKCTSCGACIRSCGHNAVSIESIDAMVERMENADLYLSRIRRLEQEVSQLNDRLERTEENFRALLERYPSAAAVCDSKGNVLMSNIHFRRFSPDRALSANISEILNPEISSMLLRGLSGEQVEFTVKHSGKSYAVTGVGLAGGDILCLLDDLNDDRVASGRVVEALEKAIVRQMETVRKIGTILGDDTSITLNDINRALELLDARDEEQK